MNLSVKFFPFAPGIPWKIKAGKYVVPEISAPLWQSLTKDKELTVICNGGLLESFFSCTILEAINYISPKSSLSWAGDVRHLPLIKINGLAKIHDNYKSLSQNVAEQFPTPIFLDKQNNVYFNCLNNYIKVFSYYGKFGYQDKRASCAQIFQNSLLSWDEQFIPRLRNYSSNIDNLIKLPLLQNKSFVLILPDIIGYSNHQDICLDLEPIKIKSLAAMLFQKNIATIVMTNSPAKYFDSQIQTIAFDLELFLYLAQKSKSILSREPDFLLITNAISKAKIISKPLQNHLDLKKNNKILNRGNITYTNRDLSPLEIFNKIME